MENISVQIELFKCYWRNKNIITFCFIINVEIMIELIFDGF